MQAGLRPKREGEGGESRNHRAISQAGGLSPAIRTGWGEGAGRERWRQFLSICRGDCGLRAGKPLSSSACPSQKWFWDKDLCTKRSRGCFRWGWLCVGAYRNKGHGVQTVLALPALCLPMPSPIPCPRGPRQGLGGQHLPVRPTSSLVNNLW